MARKKRPIDPSEMPDVPVSCNRQSDPEIVVDPARDRPRTEPVLAMPPEPPMPTPAPAQIVGSYEMNRLRKILIESAKRRIESLKLYEPLPKQEEFHASPAPERVARGSNRSGKTLVGAVEVARAVTGQDPLGKYSKTDGRFFCVGKDGKHVGQVMWRKLGRAGAFKIIRDQVTGNWRAFRPWLPEDQDRESEAKPAPPLIPPRLIKEIAWENKKEGVPNVVTLQNGWELAFFSSLGSPPQGSDIDGAWFDEEIVDQMWYPEISFRLLDRKGSKFIWTATPQTGTEQLYELHERANDLRGTVNPLCEEFHLTLADNPHIGAEQKQQVIDKVTSEEDRRVRIEGEYAITSFRVFPNWSLFTHGVEPFEVPRHWTRYAAVDPGHQVCAVLFAAMPPPSENTAGQVYLYDELYLKRCDAAKFGEMMAAHCGDFPFEAFIIDQQMARHTELGIGKNVEVQYSEALKANKVHCRRTGYGFLWGSSDIEAGIEAIRRVLRVRENNLPSWRVFRSLGHLDHEMKRYHFKRDAKGDLTDKMVQKNNHLIDALRYLAMADIKYRKPQAASARENGVLTRFKERERAKLKRNGDKGGIHLGPTVRA